MIDPSPFDWQETLTGEMLLLKLSGRVFYTYPDNAARAWLQSLIAEDVFFEAPFAADKDETQAGLELLQKWGQAGLTDEAFQNMQTDYTRLFIGPGKVLAPVWESVHYSEDRLIFQQRTLEVRAWYQRFGLEADRKYQEPDDHIGLEMLFLSHLAALGLQALADQDDAQFKEILRAQQEFFQKHFGTWALAWCDLVERHAKTDFYKGLALLTHGAIFTLAEGLSAQPQEEAMR